MYDRRITAPARRGGKRRMFIFAALALAALSFFAGYKLRGRMTAEALLTAYAKYVGNLPSHKHPEATVAEVMATDYAPLIGIRTPADVESLRHRAIAHVWRGKPVSYDQLRPNRVIRNEIFLPLEDIGSIAAIDRLIVDMPFGVNSVVLHLKAKDPQSCLMLYQEGHRVSFLEHKRFLKRVLNEGCDVLALSFPLTGPINNRPLIDHPRFGKMLLNDPDDLALLDTDEDSYLYYFVAPMVASLNHALGESSYGRIGATGFSGGGWAVEVLAAFDPRIQASYTVAGSAPIGVHAAKPGWGSPEQRDGRFYNIVNYTELYAMGSVGAGRRQLQFFNLTDPCCFAGSNWAAYRTAVAHRARSLGGNFRVLTYEDPNHRLTKPVGLAIIDDFVNGGRNLPPELRDTD